MSTQPPVRRTYSRRALASSSSGSLPSLAQTSSPRPSSVLFTPPPSSPPRLSDFLPASSPRATPADDAEPSSAAASSSSAQPLKSVDSNVALVRPVQSSLKGFFTPAKRKRTREASTLDAAAESTSRPAKPSVLTQLHLTHLPLLHTCAQCHMSFVRGGTDAGVHDRHHARVVRGIPWDGRRARDAWVLGEVDVGKGKGQVVMVGATVKVTDILQTVDTVLSSPPLPPAIRAHCKVFLVTTSAPPPAKTAKRQRPSGAKDTDRVVAVVVAQPIKWAMRVLPADERIEGAVDSGDGVFCDPTPLPTPLGIHRLFTIPSYRSLGLAQALLDAAARHTVYGCRFDALAGDVAFSQPTESGRRAMERWARGKVRVFVDDESQI
ncbi:hypothetical protein Q5752_005523 [Cryptotrichosporon argae]